MRLAALPLAACILLTGCIASVGAPVGPAPLPAAAVACAFPCGVPVATGTYREFEPSVGLNPLRPDTVVLAAAEDLIADAPGFVKFPLGLESPVTGSSGPLQTPGSYRIGIHTSHDAGATWATHFLPWLGNAPPLSAWNLFCVYGDPVLAYTSDGILHLINVASHCATELKADQGFSLIHSASADDGATWGEPSLVFPGEFLVLADDKPWFAADPATGNLAVAWTGFVGLGFGLQALLVGVSEDGGATWTLALPPPARAGVLEYFVDTPLYDTPASNYFTSVAWGPGAALHVAGMDYCGPGPYDFFTDFPDCVRAWTSLDLGKTWRDSKVGDSVNPLRTGAQQTQNPYPALAVDRATGRVHAAYLDGATGDYDALLRWSDDQAATWSDPVRLSTDPEGNGADQFQLGLAVDEAGVVHAAFWDRRADPGNRAIQTTWARYDPATGALTNAFMERPWDPDPGNNGGQFLGDYNTVAAAGGRVAVAWNVATAQKPGTQNTNINWDIDVHAAVLAP